MQRSTGSTRPHRPLQCHKRSCAQTSPLLWEPDPILHLEQKPKRGRFDLVGLDKVAARCGWSHAIHRRSSSATTSHTRLKDRGHLPQGKVGGDGEILHTRISHPHRTQSALVIRGDWTVARHRSVRLTQCVDVRQQYQSFGGTNGTRR